MKTIPYIATALLGMFLLSSCANDLELVSVKDKPLIEDHLTVDQGRTFRVRRYVMNEIPLETVKEVKLVSR
ncbi:MAG: hypothetical protein U0984_11075 [Prosthecobacter sp.]|nr:hypothetical protein [Prosthecobacter sp.]